MTRLTKSNFESLASVLREHCADGCDNEIVEVLADWCTTQSPRFDRERFLEAVWRDAAGAGGGARNDRKEG